MTSTLLRHRPRVLTVVACGVGLVLAVSGCDSTQDARQAVSDAASDARARLDKALDDLQDEVADARAKNVDEVASDYPVAASSAQASTAASIVASTHAGGAR